MIAPQTSAVAALQRHPRHGPAGRGGLRHRGPAALRRGRQHRGRRPGHPLPARPRPPHRATTWAVPAPGWTPGSGPTAGPRPCTRPAREQPEVLAGDWSARSGYEIGLQLARRPEVTAVFCANDHMALGLLRALAEQGRRVPEDVSVVGFDDIPEAAFFLPAADHGPAGLRRAGQAGAAAAGRTRICDHRLGGAHRCRSTRSSWSAPAPPGRAPDQPAGTTRSRRQHRARWPLALTTERGTQPGRDACVVGVDFGTLSGRALVVRVGDGAELGTAVHEYRARGDGRRAGRHRGAAAAGLGAAGPGGLPRRAARTRCPPRSRPAGIDPRRGHRHRHRLHRLHGAAGPARRHAAVPAARAGRPPARLPQAVEAPRRPAAGRPDQRAGPRARASRGSAGTAARSPPSGSSPRALQLLEEDPEIYARGGPLDRGGRLDHLAAVPAPRPATPAPPGTRASTRTAATRPGTSWPRSNPRLRRLRRRTS